MCMAGLAKTFSHIGAVLHWVEAAVYVNEKTLGMYAGDCGSSLFRPVKLKIIKILPYLYTWWTSSTQN